MATNLYGVPSQDGADENGHSSQDEKSEDPSLERAPVTPPSTYNSTTEHPTYVQDENLQRSICHYCGDVKKGPEDLQRHLRKHTGERPFICKICRKTFKAKRSLQYHQYMYHSANEEKSAVAAEGNAITHNHLGDNAESSTSKDMAADEEVGKYDSLLDGVNSPSVHSTHSQDSEVLSDKNNNDPADERSLVNPNKLRYNRPITLGQCINSVLDNYDAYESEVEEEDRNANRAVAEGIMVYNNGHSDNESNFTSQSSPKVGDDGYDDNAACKVRKCQYCGKICPKPSDLKRHLMVHTGERPFKCLVCGKAFKAKPSLLYHEKVAHNMDVELSQGLEERYLRLRTNQKQKEFLQLKLSYQAEEMPELDSMDTLSGNQIAEKNNSGGPPVAENSPLSQSHPEGSIGGSSMRAGKSSCSASLGSPVDDPENNDGYIIEYPSHFPGMKQKIRVFNELVVVTKLEGVNVDTGEDAELYQCHLCGRILDSLSRLQCHLSMHFERQLAIFECPLCGIHFSFKTQLHQHMIVRHKVKNSNYADYAASMNTSTDLPPSAGNYSIKPAVSGENLSPDMSYYDDADKNAVVDMETESSSSSSKAAMDQIFSQNSTNPKTVSPTSTPSESMTPALPLDSKSSNENKLHHAFGFYGVNNFVRRKDKKFGSGHKNHYQRVNGAYVCQYCNKSFYRLFCLQRHERVHTGYKPCYCRICRKGFSEWRNLRQHIARFHWKTARQELEFLNMKQNQSGSEPYIGSQEKDAASTEAGEGIVRSSDAIEYEFERQHTDPTDFKPPSSESETRVHEDAIVIQPHEEEQERALSLVQDHEHLDDDVTVVIPSDAPLNSEAEDRASYDMKEDATWDNNSEPEGSREDSPSDEIVSAPVKTILSNYKSHGKLKRISISTGDESTSAADGVGHSDAKPETSTTLEPLKIEPGSDSNAPCLSSPSPTMITSPGLPQSFLHSPRLPMYSPYLPTAMLAGQFPYMPGFFSSLMPHALPKEVSPPTSGRLGTTVPGWPVVEPKKEEAHSSRATLSSLSRNSSLARTHSRLNVVRSPVRREEACKPTVLPDGRTVYRCTYCFKDFASYSDINRHMDFHEDIRPYKCKYCDYYARTNSQLKVHMMRHQGIREFHCKLCNYKGVTQSDLNRHMKSQIHMMKAQNACRDCGEGFVSYKNLEVHKSLCKGPGSRPSDSEKTGTCVSRT